MKKHLLERLVELENEEKQYQFYPYSARLFSLILKHLDHFPFYQRIQKCNLTGSYQMVYDRLNSGGHPIRDGLILLCSDLGPLKNSDKTYQKIENCN